jgi:transcription elongation factor Elf1
MATSQCLKCGNRFFESVVKIPIGSPRRIMFVQCSVCGGVVGVQEEHGLSSKKNPERIDQMQQPVRSPFKAQTIVPSDINTVLKQLYG